MIHSNGIEEENRNLPNPQHFSFIVTAVKELAFDKTIQSCLA